MRGEEAGELSLASEEHQILQLRTNFCIDRVACAAGTTRRKEGFKTASYHSYLSAVVHNIVHKLATIYSS